MVIGVGLVVISAVADVLDVAHDLGLFAYLGLMLVCWIGAGGALVPVPGVRPLSWIMIVQQASSLDPVLVSVLAAVAMALGQTSLFIATRAGQHHLAHKHAHHDLTIGVGATDAAVLQATDHPPRPAPPPRPWDPIVVRSRALLMRGRASVSRRMVTHPRRIIFVLSVIPTPLTTFATVTANADRHDTRRRALDVGRHVAGAAWRPRRRPPARRMFQGPDRTSLGPVGLAAAPGSQHDRRDDP